MRRRFIRRPSGKQLTKVYASFREFVADAASGPECGGTAAWAGTNTLGEAVDLAFNGWPEGWQQMKALRDLIFARMASQVHRDRVQFRVAGGAVNVGRFLSGRPDCFAARVRSNEVKEQRSRKVVRVVVNVGARAGVSPDAFFARGAAAVTLIEALERAGMRVQVDMVSLATDGRSGRVQLSTRIKHVGEPVQLDKLAYCLAHPALHRKLNFALRMKHVGWVGGSIEVPEAERGDIYIDAADSRSNEVWLDAEAARKWVLARLAEQGVMLRAA